MMECDPPYDPKCDQQCDPQCGSTVKMFYEKPTETERVVLKLEYFKRIASEKDLAIMTSFFL